MGVELIWKRTKKGMELLADGLNRNGWTIRAGIRTNFIDPSSSFLNHVYAASLITSDSAALSTF